MTTYTRKRFFFKILSKLEDKDETGPANTVFDNGYW